MDNPSGSPAIPTRTSARPPHTTHRRLRSLPPDSSKDNTQPSHRSINRVNLQPASPEVISSLINSLSAISTPAENHFDNLPQIGQSHTAPASPITASPPLGGYGAKREPSQSPSRRSLGIRRTSRKNMNEEFDNTHLHPEDAALPPVVRMGRRSSSASTPSTSRFPRRVKSGESLVTTREDIPDPRDSDLLNRSTSAASLASSGSGGKVKSRESRGRANKLAKKSSSELPKIQERRLGDQGSGDSSEKGLGISGSESGGYAMIELTESNAEDEHPTSSVDVSPQMDSDVSPKISSAPASPVMEFQRSSSATGGGRAIPNRDSSLRHSYSGSPAAKKRRSGRHSRYSSTGSKDMKLESPVEEEISEADQVTKRIEELKAQKRLREGMTESEDMERKPKPRSNPPVALPRASSYQGSPYRPRQVSPVTVEEALVNVHATREDPGDDLDSAPAPLVARLNRTSTGPLTATAGNIQATPQRVSHDLQRSQTDLPQRRSSSRLKRHSRPGSPQSNEKLQRHFSSPTGRPSMAIDERPSSADSIDIAVQDFIDAPRLTQKIPHPQTGRLIAFSEVGDPNGYAVLCCVGMGLTRYLTAFYDELALTLKLRLITPDRPGVGESEPITDGSGTPLSWADDVSVICNYLKITKFSLLAHSAGAIYALATALRMPQHIRGRLHLLAPWIPPSQMSGPGSLKEPLAAGSLPYSQRLLRALPTPFLKAANSSFMSATSASITSALPKSPRRTKRKSTGPVAGRETPALRSETPGLSNGAARQSSSFQPLAIQDTTTPGDPRVTSSARYSKDTQDEETGLDEATLRTLERLRQNDYDNRLTHAIWDHATTNANPAVDLLVCLERRQPIGFRYVDITRAVVIHHGTRDTRVPVDNVKWLGKTMRRCEVRILDGEGHGLMASAGVMGNVLMEAAKEWDDWSTVTGKRVESSHRKRSAVREAVHV